MRSIPRPGSESASKELNAPVVASRDTMEAAGLALSLDFEELLLRGRSTTLPVCALDVEDLRELIRGRRVVAV